MSDVRRVLRAAFRNALVWGAAWGTAGLLLLNGLRLAGAVPRGIDFVDTVGMAIKFAVMGGIASTAFAFFIRYRYVGRRLADISWVKFGLAGGVLTGVFVPLFMQLMNLLSGDGLVPWSLVADDILISSVLGAVAAGGSLRVAQRARVLDAPPARPTLERAADAEHDEP